MSILSKAIIGKIGRAQKTVIYAPEGFGKSTLASLFPSPFFFDIEGSTAQLDVQRLDRAALPDLKTLEAGLVEVAKTKPCATLVIDTADWLEQMATEAIIADANSKKITGIEDFGYGKGYTILKERFTVTLARFDDVIRAGIHVVLLAHSKVVKFEPPDSAGPYDRYELKLSKHVAPLLKEWADALFFGTWRTQVREREKGEAGAQFKGVGGKERVMYCVRTAAWDAKNRHGLKDAEPWEISVIERAFRGVGAPWANLEAEAPAAAILVVDSSPATPSSSAVETSPVVAPASSPAVDDIPMQHDATGRPVETASTGPQPVKLDDADLIKVCKPHEATVNAFLVARKEIKPGQTFLDLNDAYRRRILGNPAGFLKVAGGAK